MGAGLSARLGRAQATPTKAEPASQERERGIPQGREKQERKEVRMGSECGTQMDNRDSREDPLSLPVCQGAESWFALCSAPTVISSTDPTCYCAHLLCCCVTLGWPLNLSGHPSAQESQ